MVANVQSCYACSALRWVCVTINPHQWWLGHWQARLPSIPGILCPWCHLATSHTHTLHIWFPAQFVQHQHNMSWPGVPKHRHSLQICSLQRSCNFFPINIKGANVVCGHLLGWLSAHIWPRPVSAYCTLRCLLYVCRVENIWRRRCCPTKVGAKGLQHRLLLWLLKLIMLLGANRA